MSIENVKKFYAILQKDKILQYKLKDLELSKVAALDSKKQIELDPIIEKIIPIAKEYGCDFSVKDFKEFREDLILKNISGGFTGVCIAVGGGLLKSNHCYKMKLSAGGGLLGCVVVGAGVGIMFGKGDDDESRPSCRFCIVLGGGSIIRDPISDGIDKLRSTSKDEKKE